MGYIAATEKVFFLFSKIGNTTHEGEYKKERKTEVVYSKDLK